MLTDAIGYEYSQLFRSKTSSFAILTMLHTRVWTRLIEDDKPAALSARRQLLDIARQERISEQEIEFIDGIIFDGIFNVISRKQRSIGERRDPRSQALYEVAIAIGEFRVLLRPKEQTVAATNSFQRIINEHLQ